MPEPVQFLTVATTGLESHQSSVRTYSSASASLLKADSHDGPRSSTFSFETLSTVSTAPSEQTDNGANDSSSLNDAIWKAKRNLKCKGQSSRTMYHRFLPADEIPRLITVEAVRNELASTNNFPDHVLSRVALDIVPDRMKLFAILTMMGKGNLIVELVQENIRDTHLPFDLIDYADTLSCQIKSNDGTFKTYNIQAFTPTTGVIAHWCSSDSVTFYDYQWELLAPHLDMACPYGNDCPTTSTEPAGYMFEPNEVLPFLKPDNDGSSIEHFGGCSLVVKVEIHPAHRSHCLVESCARASRRASHAVKIINKGFKRSVVENEINNLKRFVGEQHRDRLVQLLCWFEYQKQPYLVFPWADGNLQHLWEKHSPPHNVDFARWVAGEMLGIAQGLDLIHNPSPSGNSEPTKGRHGDIKPENILWFRGHGAKSTMGILKISDFGLTDFHREASLAVPVGRINMTPTYSPPEIEKRRGFILPSYDMWSLGCVMLQFVTWYVLGWQGVDDFSERRCESSRPLQVHDHHVPDDTFYTLTRRPSLNAAVQDQFDMLRGRDECSDMFVEILNLIKGKLLLIDETKRPSSGQLVRELKLINTKCCDHAAYCTSRTPPSRSGARALFKLSSCCF